MAGSYTRSTNDEGQFSCAPRAGDGALILRSETYVSRAAAEDGITPVRKIGPLDERSERTVAADRRHCFDLRAAGHEVIGAGQMHASAAGRDAGIGPVQMGAASATLETDG